MNISETKIQDIVTKTVKLTGKIKQYHTLHIQMK